MTAAARGLLHRAWPLAALWGLAPALLVGCPQEPQCDERVPLVDMTAFSLVEPEDDPFAPPADAALCDGTAVRAEPFGNGPIALDVDTSFGCGWATVVQPSLVDLEEGDHVLPRVFYFSQQTFPASEAELALRIDDTTVWTHKVPIPTDSNVVAPDLKPRLQAPVGARVFFHLGNHGANTWNLIELFRMRRVPCSTLADAGAP